MSDPVFLNITKGGKCVDCGREMLDGGTILGQKIYHCVCWEDEE